MNRADNLFRQARERPGATALVFGDRRISFSNWWSEAAIHADGLLRQGVRHGDRVAFFVGTRPDFMVLQFACFAIGAVVMPLNTLYRPEEVEHAVTQCEADYVLTEASLLDRFPPAFAARCPSVRRIYVLDRQEAADGLLAPAGDLRGTAGQFEAPVDLPPEALGQMLYTSATTGRAKGVMLTQANLAANYDASPGWLGYTGADTILCALPLFNTFALNQCINATTVTGGTLVVLPKFEAVACMQAIERHRCTVLPCVPTMLQKMLSHPQIGDVDLTSLNRIMVGAAPVPTPLLLRARAFFGQGLTVITGYGLTEGTALVTTMEVRLDGEGRQLRERSIGTAVPGVDVAILGEVSDVLSPLQVGEIGIRGPNVMAGYYRQEAETAVALAGGWLHTGDVGYRDDEGYFWIVDRKKDVIIRGGQNIYPADIEEALYSHPAVAEAAVIACEDELFGEVPCAFVAFRPGTEATTEELAAICKERLAPFKLPKTIEVLAELPKGPTGKILRRGLRATAQLTGARIDV
jgi:long-chain acyl-CoA synthetase